MTETEERVMPCAVCKQSFVVNVVRDAANSGAPDLLNAPGGWFAFSGAEGLLPTVHCFCSQKCAERLLELMRKHVPS